MKIAYLACPYSHPDPKVKQMRLAAVNKLAFEYIKEGIFVYSPLTHNIPINEQGINGGWEEWKNYDHEMLARCDYLIVAKLPGWEESNGVNAEIEHAKKLGRPIEWKEVPENYLSDGIEVSSPFKELLGKMIKFYAERDWGKFHSPKNLAMNLGVEVGELMDHFRWLTEEQSFVKSEQTLSEIRDEIGDVFIVLLHLSSRLGIDPHEAAENKLIKLGKKYPADKCKGSCQKYTVYN